MKNPNMVLKEKHNKQRLRCYFFEKYQIKLQNIISKIEKKRKKKKLQKRVNTKSEYEERFGVGLIYRGRRKSDFHFISLVSV